MQHQNRQFILQDPLNRVMWKLALPAIAAMVLFGLNAFMDTVYIGQLMNETALAGVGLAYPLTSILFGLGSWAGTGAANLLSIVLGNNDEEQQKRIIPNTTLFLLFITVIFAVPAYIWAESLVRMMGGSGEVPVSYTHLFLNAGYGLEVSPIPSAGFYMGTNMTLGTFTVSSTSEVPHKAFQKQDLFQEFGFNLAFQASVGYRF